MITITPGVAVGSGVRFEFEPVAYLYYRWQITAIRGGPGSDGLLQAAEFVFRLDSVDQTATTGSATVSNPGGTSPVGEEPDKLIDNNLNTKWLDFNFTTNGNLSNFVFQFASPQAFNGYRWATANDSPPRDPRSWTVSGSDNGVDWTVLHTVTDFTATTARNTYQTAQTY